MLELRPGPMVQGAQALVPFSVCSLQNHTEQCAT